MLLIPLAYAPNVDVKEFGATSVSSIDAFTKLIHFVGTIEVFLDPDEPRSYFYLSFEN